MAEVNVQRVGRGEPERLLTHQDPQRLAKRAACPVAPAPGFLSWRASTSEGVPLSTSELRKQAQPGGRSAAHVQWTEAKDGWGERPASGEGCPRAAADPPRPAKTHQTCCLSGRFRSRLPRL